MKKFGLLVMLLISNLLITGCSEKNLQIKSEYIPIEERSKILKENPWNRSNKEDVYPVEWLRTLDTGIGNYPYSDFVSKFFNNLILFEANSEDGLISRFAIYDRDNHKWLFDCFDGGGGGYIEADKTIGIDTINVMSCREKYDETITYLK